MSQIISSDNQISPPITLNDYIYNSYQTALKHGFWEGLDHDNVTVILSKLMLIVTEVSEAAEAIRVKVNSSDTDTSAFAEELADICIRVFDLAGATGCNLQSAIQQKMAKNETRPHMHGKLA